MDYESLLIEIKKEFPDKAIDIVESLDLLKMTINDTIDAVGEKINKSFTEKDYDKISYYSEIAKEMGGYENRLEDLILILDLEDIELNEKEDDDRTIPDYDEYIIDHNIAYSLYENFTHKRPYGFKLKDNELTKVRTWQDMLIQTCEYLIRLDEDKFLNLENKKSMNGKKKKYFSKDPKGMRNPKPVSNKMYVETNQSSNAIRNLIVKLLKEYKININEFKIYLRADYTTLNEK